ncbi:MAG: ATP-binding protein [Dehalococcoidia bacterium]
MGVLSRLSLQYQIAAGVIIGIVVLLGAFGWLAAQTIRQTRDLAFEGRLDTAYASAHAIDAILLHEAEELEEAASQMAEMESAQSERDLLPRLYKVLEAFRIIVRLDEDGQPLWTVPFSLDTGEWDLASDPEVSRAVRSGQATIIRPSLPDPDRVLFALLIAPIVDEAGEVTGFLAGELDVAQEHLELIPLATLGEETTAFLVDDAGGVIHQAAGPPLAEDWDAAAIQHLIRDREQGTAIHKSGASHVEAYHPLETIPAGVVVEVREDRALAISRTLERNMLFIGIGGVMVASVGAWLHSRGVVRPIRELTAASAKMASGSLDEPIPVNRGDEVGQLAQSFETMRMRLRESLEEHRQWEEQLEARVRERTREVQSLLGKVISAQEEERMRIARELHDESAQNLVALLAGVQTAEAALPSSPEKAQQTLASLRPLAKRALEEMRKSILDLRPSALDDLGLAPAIRWYAESRLNPLDIALHWETTGEPEQLPEPTSIAIFRITQEAITNVVKHAQASQVWIRLHFTDSTVAIEVTDDGRGFDYEKLRPSVTDTRGLGILGMKERASLMGGTVEIDSTPGAGTTVRIVVPLHQGGGDIGEDSLTARG